MKEARSTRFKRLAEARVNKIIKMVRLLGNLSVTTIYAYEPDQIVQIFTAIQDELNKARSRFYEAGKQSRKRFTLSDAPMSDLSEEREPNFEVMLPDGTMLRAVGFEEDEYPGICIYARSPGKPPAIICLTEYNPEKNSGHRLYIGAYQSHLDDPKYYEPYVAERN